MFTHLSLTITKRSPARAYLSPIIKRAFDIAFSLIALISLSPLYLVLVVLVKITSKGPIFYAHPRVGKNFTSFYCYKFRTMFADSEARLQTILQNDPIKKQEWLDTQKLKKDPRITPIGKYLRQFSLDELPQLWNVLKGELSIVGPRPLVEEEIMRHVKDDASILLSIKPGLTCLWQISGRSDLSYTKRIALDLYYIHNRTFFLDLYIIAKTLPAMITSRGAY